MSHDCIVGSSVQLIEVNTIEVFFFCNDRTDQWWPGEGLGGKKVFLETEFPPYLRVWMTGAPHYLKAGSGTADEVKNSKTIPTSKLNSEEVISY